METETELGAGRRRIRRRRRRRRHRCDNWIETITEYVAMNMRLSLAPLGGGGQRPPPCDFSQIAPEVLGISL